MTQGSRKPSFRCEKPFRTVRNRVPSGQTSALLLPARALRFLLVSFTFAAGACTASPATKRPQLATPSAESGRQPLTFARDVLPVLERYCVSCHGNTVSKGGLNLADYRTIDESGAARNLALWHKVADQLENRDMPPEERPRPSAAEIDRVVGWIGAISVAAAAHAPPDPGRVTVRRLNRREYAYTVEDLLGVEVDAHDELPPDDVGYGFDNVGDVLTMSPAHFESYLVSAETIATRAVVADVPSRRQRVTLELERVAVLPPGSRRRERWLRWDQPGTLRTRHHFAAPGHYDVAIRGTARAGKGAQLRLRIGDRDLTTFALAGTEVHRTRVRIEQGGPQRIELVISSGGSGPLSELGIELDQLTIDGPDPKAPVPLPPSHTRLLPISPPPHAVSAKARELVGRLSERAFRRPADAATIGALARLIEAAVAKGETFERGLQRALVAILVAPQFLFRVELDPQPGRQPFYQLDDWALASRLSYFLWSALPDDELMALARAGQLGAPGVMEAQALRMLRHDKAKRLARAFAPQWLQIQPLAVMQPDRTRFPSFDDGLRMDMFRESELFFATVVADDLTLETFLDADFTFVNHRLAAHYGLGGLAGGHFRRVTLPDRQRGGVLTQASVLTVTSNPTRTSPVKRGRWVLEQLLGDPPPPAPPNVPQLSERKRDSEAVSARRQLERHRTDPNCAVCHRKMDPLGLGLERFDAIGAIRQEDDGLPIDSVGVLPGGQRFDGIGELKHYLRGQRPRFHRSFAEKLLTYALGRGLEASDRTAIDTICARLASGDGRFSALVGAIVDSAPFRGRNFPEVGP